MDQAHSTTEKRTRGKHLTYEDRITISLRLKDGWSVIKIAQELNCAPNTVRNEIKRGTVSLYNGSVKRYKPDAGQALYEKHRLHCGRCNDFLAKSEFIAYVEEHFRQDNWSLDACFGHALQEGKFSRQQIVCTKTLYRYVDLGLLSIRNIDLPEKLKRSVKHARIRKNKKILGRSIEERPAEIDTRKEFGHWECDLVIGQKTGEDEVLLTLSERKTREFLMIKIPDRRPENVMAAFGQLQEMYSEHFKEVFKTVTTDNGTEFSLLSSLEELAGTLVYFAHPYTSCEKGTVERHNGLIRRFIRKGERISNYTLEQIAQIEMWCNGLPRKILGYKTPDEIFEKELDLIYARVA